MFNIDILGGIILKPGLYLYFNFDNNLLLHRMDISIIFPCHSFVFFVVIVILYNLVYYS